MPGAAKHEADSIPQGSRSQGGADGVAGNSADVEGGGRAVDFADSSGDGQPSAGGAVLPGPCSRAGITFEDAAVIARGGDVAHPEFLEAQQRLKLQAGETERLITWANVRELWVEDWIFQQIAGEQGDGTEPVHGQEHYVRAFRAGDGERVWKVTRGTHYGVVPSCDGTKARPSDWFALRPAIPSEYLRRMGLLNVVAPEIETRLEGFFMDEGNIKIVTSQRYFDPEQVRVPPGEVEHYFELLGFTDLLMTAGPEWMTCAWYHQDENLAVFDAWPKNTIPFDGRLYPVDVIPISPGPIMADLIKRALEVPLGSR